MKKFILPLLWVLILFSCNEQKKDGLKNPDTHEETENKNPLSIEENLATLFGTEFPKKWVLVEMSTMRVDSQTSGEDMLYQEYYEFYADSKFLKNRQLKNEILKANGTYQIIKTEDGEKMVKLTYSSRVDLVENCLGNNLEFLIITPKSYLQNTANACDHPTKTYHPLN